MDGTKVKLLELEIKNAQPALAFDWKFNERIMQILVKIMGRDLKFT